jgi:hypothetical protein
MNSQIKTALIVLAILAIASVLVISGFFFGQRWYPGFASRFNTAGQGWGNSGYSNQTCGGLNCGIGNSGQGFGRGSMGRFFNNTRQWNYGMGPGMMGGGFAYQTANSDPLSMEEARSSFEAYLTNWGNDDLEIHEIMLFEQNAYAIVVEKSTGMGAMELLADPASGNVFPEYGPNRMWNTKYGMMSGRFGFSGGAGCGMGFNFGGSATGTDNAISMDEAAGIASEYLTSAITGAELVDEGYPFYGYYTFDYMQDGRMAGMLSVNASSGRVWEHTWHGQFIDEWELEEND